MPYQKTTVVPDANPAPVFASAVLKVVIIGNRPELVEIADHLATQSPFDDRVVIWFTEGLPNAYAVEFGIADPDALIAFSLGTGNEFGASIPDTTADYAGVDYLYNRAGQNSIN